MLKEETVRKKRLKVERLLKRSIAEIMSKKNLKAVTV